jgi:type IV secretory pathway TrbF-like protein
MKFRESKLLGYAFFRKKVAEGSKDDEQNARNKFCKQLENNPYLQSRALWNDVYGGIEKKLWISQVLNFLMGVLVFTCIVGLIILSQRVSIKPYPFIVHGDEVITVNQKARVNLNEVKPDLAIFLGKQYVRYARSVSSDPRVNTKNRMAVFSMSRQQAFSEIKQYYKQHSPNDVAKKQVNQIKITSVLQRSENSLDIRWQEQWQNMLTGELLQTKNYLAEIVFDFDNPSKDPLILENNPLGFYVKQLSWSEEKTREED